MSAVKLLGGGAAALVVAWWLVRRRRDRSPSIHVHLDLKGLPLAPAYLCDVVLPTIRSNGATGVLMEWEDMLPYSGALASLASPHAYSECEVQEVLHAASTLGLEVSGARQNLAPLDPATTSTTSGRSSATHHSLPNPTPRRSSRSCRPWGTASTS